MTARSLYLLACGRSIDAMQLERYGFGSAPGAAKLAPLAKHPDLAMYYTGAFVVVERAGLQQALADVEVREAYVYDEQYRSDVGYLGFHVIIRVREDVYAAMADYDAPGTTAQSFTRTALLFRIPAPDFEMPSRMEKLPEEFRQQDFKQLQRWTVDNLEITRLSEERASSDPEKGVSELFELAAEETLTLSR